MIPPRPRFLAVLILTSVSGLAALNRETLPRFEVGGGLRLLMPRQEFTSGWGVGVDGTWNFSGRYGFNLKYDAARVTPDTGGPSVTLSTLMGSAEFSFRRSRHAHGFTSLGMAAVSREEDLLFVFGVGMKVRLSQRLLLRLELKDFFTQLGIPFLSFPGGLAALQGQGMSRYLQFSAGLSAAVGRKTAPRQQIPWRPWKW